MLSNLNPIESQIKINKTLSYLITMNVAHQFTMSA